jgi:hypothetical protein
MGQANPGVGALRPRWTAHYTALILRGTHRLETPHKKTAGLPRPFVAADVAMDQNSYFRVNKACQRDTTRPGLVELSRTA